MSGPLQLIGDWGHVVAAGLFAVLAIWTGRRFSNRTAGKMLVAALSLTSIWLLSIAFGGVDRLETGVTESLRNCGWLVCLFLFPAQAGSAGMRHVKGAMPLYAVLALLLLAQCGLDIMASLAVEGSAHADRIGTSALLLRMLWAIGALILTSRVFIASGQEQRVLAAPVAAALTAMWGYDLLLYSSALLEWRGIMVQLFALRGAMMAALAPVIALVLRARPGQPVTPSRTLAWGGLGALAGFGMMLLLLAGLLAVESLSSPLVRAVVTGVLFAAVAGILLFVPATRLHALLKVLVAKHLFRHRYDYREQWMAFADTIGTAGPLAPPLRERVLKAMADITTSSAALLFLPDEAGRLTRQAGWNWKGEMPDTAILAPSLLQMMQSRAWVVDVAQMRAARDPDLPDWMHRDERLWALVPLLHFGRLLGAVLLTRPPLLRPLDWEDFDMLRAAGRQVAGYIAEERGQQALEEARRFEEFNRRFAFIMHDIKNLVSQIALVARNAERHADNPEFRKDMVLTLGECTDKMNMLLARLSRQEVRGDREIAPFALGDAVRAVVAVKGQVHPVLVEGDSGVAVEADRAAVEQILEHLTQNAIDASDAQAPVVLRIERQGDGALLSVIDHGCGMTGEFLRDQLFRPFASTKQGGFGIGAYEARELARSMGGHLKVESTPGRGSVFTLHLPLAGKARSVPDSKERAAR
ncbi:MAG: PEP-CTERM system histidine kinase PrsK [Sphingomonadales bacterium]|nr:MAG: PEP-CTERM system histidine kinase PrsK [Sphingomonadales bacterium]TNF02005.1 MAG: PEP-CTERM system histidine kinase PrsK [Sphingomonadales bacterium]